MWLEQCWQLDSTEHYNQAFDSKKSVVGIQVVDKQLDTAMMAGRSVVVHSLVQLDNLVAFDTQEVHKVIVAHNQVALVLWVA